MNADTNLAADPAGPPRAVATPAGETAPHTRKSPSGALCGVVDHLPSVQAAMQAFRQSLRLLDA